MASGNLIISQSATCPESDRVHLMACEIDHDGDANVAAYFDSNIREEGTSTALQNGAKGDCV